MIYCVDLFGWLKLHVSHSSCSLLEMTKTKLLSWLKNTLRIKLLQSEEDQQHWQKQASGHPADRCACCWFGSGARSCRRISGTLETSLDGSAMEVQWWTIIFRERFIVLLFETTKEFNLKGEINHVWTTVIFEDRSLALTKTGKKCFVYNFDRELALINNKAKLTAWFQ